MHRKRGFEERIVQRHAQDSTPTAVDDVLHRRTTHGNCQILLATKPKPVHLKVNPQRLLDVEAVWGKKKKHFLSTRVEAEQCFVAESKTIARPRLVNGANTVYIAT